MMLKLKVLASMLDCKVLGAGIISYAVGVPSPELGFGIEVFSVR